MLRCTNCTIRDRTTDCPLRGTPRFPCGFDADEIARRKTLPLKWDDNVMLQRKFIGTETAVDE